MPRDIPVGNGQMLVCFDQHYRLRDLYYPHVGQENHAGGGPFRFGVWAEVLDEKVKSGERRKRRVYWTDDGWDIERRYREDTLSTDVTLRNAAIGFELRCTDAVDFHRPLLVRRIDVVNLTDKAREARLVHHHDLHLFGTKVGDTAYFDPQLRSLIHYRRDRYVMCCFYKDGEQSTDEYATGTAGFGGAEGTWRDAEDGKLGNNPIAQGAVDSTMLTTVMVPSGGTQTVYMVIGCGKSYDECDEIHAFLHKEGPQGVIDRTDAYWKLWLQATRDDFTNAKDTGLSERVMRLFKRSLLVVRTQIDNDGAIIAANDSDYLQYSRDTYSYLWPRDGAFVADAMDGAGFSDISRKFYQFCARVITKRGMFLHKYNPDGTPASSWHPWVDGAGRPSLPIQEDETALVVWALWRHYTRNRDIEFVRPMWMRLVRPAADFLCRYRDPDTGLPLPSYDLWEERYGVHAFTVASVVGALSAAEQFAVAFGDKTRARQYGKAAADVREAFCRHMWSPQHGRFLRRVEPVDSDRTAAFLSDVMEGRTPSSGGMDVFEALAGKTTEKEESARGERRASVELYEDEVIDASMFAIHALGLLPVDDPRVEATMEAIEKKLTVKTEVGGVARYTDDHYHKIVNDVDRVPGNPWFICTLWMADWHIAKAKQTGDLEAAATYLEWVAERALPSDVLAEQVHPETNDPLSVSPLTWSHATVVATVTSYLNRLDEMKPRRLSSNGKGGGGPKGATARRPRDREAVLDPLPELD
ncbi:MAG: glycoside hydrolase family 15 protein [Planctomycetota bacterium]